MKKLTALLLGFLLVLSLTACKSSEAQAVDDLIEEIGEVTLESGSAITAAEKAYKKLIERHAGQVEFLDELEEAREEYDRLVQEEEERIAAEKKRIAELKNQAKEIDNLIRDIGQVTVDSGAAISDARAAYDAAPKDVQHYVNLFAKLVTAETDYDKIIHQAADEVSTLIDALSNVTRNDSGAVNNARKAYEALNDVCRALVKNPERIEQAAAEVSALRVAYAEELIAAIGEVTLESGTAIADAEKTYNNLGVNEKSRVTNLQVLTDAKTRLEELKKLAEEQRQKEIQKLLSGMNVENDVVRGMRFYYPKAIPRGSDYWYTNVRSFALPYIGTNTSGGKPWLRMIFNYTGSNWIFFEDITVAVDDKRYTFYYDYFDIERDNSGGEVWEYMDDDVGSYTLEMLRAIVNAKTVIIRFEGDSKYRDITMSAGDKEAIRQVLAAYDAMCAK